MLGKNMNAYKLTPLNPSHEGWARSTYNGLAKVRAESERRARALAAIRFGIMTPISSSVNVPAPWEDHKSVTCEEIFGQPDGPEGVFSPIGER